MTFVGPAVRRLRRPRSDLRPLSGRLLSAGQRVTLPPTADDGPGSAPRDADPRPDKSGRSPWDPTGDHGNKEPSQRLGRVRRVPDQQSPPAGSTAAEAVSLLVHQVIGPLPGDRVPMVLDYYGLAGRPTDALAVVAARHGVAPPTVLSYVRRVRGAATGITLPADLIRDATRPSLPGEDHPARKRIAATLHLPAPAPPSSTVTRALVSDSDARAAAITAGRVLAAAGPLPADVLVAAVARSRRFRRDPPEPDALTAALTALRLANSNPEGTWRATAAVRAPARYRAIAASAAGRDLTRQHMIDILTAAGYSAASAGGRMSSSHPLFTRTGPDRYRLVGPATGAPGQDTTQRVRQENPS